MRVISGFLKGKKIKGHGISGTRPTMDRMKESLFAILQNDIKAATCLDLFAGSGSLGIEAISNGAQLVYFVDNNKDAIKVIKDNVTSFKIEEKSIVIQKDYLQALYYFKENNIKFDLIFLDPPYNKDYILDVLNYLDNNSLLNKNGKIICEYMKINLDDCYHSFKVIKNKKYGDKKIIIYKNIILS